jgi:hypothetical protein
MSVLQLARRYACLKKEGHLELASVYWLALRLIVLERRLHNCDQD